MKRKTCLRVLAFAVLAIESQVAPAARAQDAAPTQHFVCNIGYTVEECAADMAVLRKVLAKYPVAALGVWTWVLVPSKDWKRILLDRGFNPNNPAFSYLPKRETFFEDALVHKVSSRGVELSAQWHMPIPNLLDFAVRHELSHALCDDSDETKANHLATMLEQNQPVSCATHGR